MDNNDTRGAERSIRGKANKVKGRMKDAAGALTGDPNLQAEGKWDQAKGNLQDALGKAERKLDDDDRDDLDRP
ncbi:MAG TPA: CsbD family protein [Gemmatimonadales bacterium]|nr:CsbD family protein [Gemmatimonadales bacterium]